MPRLNSRLVMALMASTALAGSPAFGGELPTGAHVVSGTIGITNPNANTLNIQQSSTTGIVNWSGFSIGGGDRVNIRQPGADSLLLNRVTGSTPSTIAGQLHANGQVYLINPNGIAITKSGVVNTGAFVASTLDIGNDDFLAGKRNFTGDGHSAAVSNAGRIAIARGGYAALIGGRVDNAGTISVPLGKIGLGAGEAATLDLSGDGFLQVAIPSTGPAGKGALIEQSGRLQADGGRIEISAATAREAARNAINLSGLAEARTVSGRSGAIVLGGGDGGSVRVTGRLDARGTGRNRHGAARRGSGTGGDITVTGESIALQGATLDASGNSGGGRIRIGGDEHGGGTLPHATTTTVDSASTIRADAIGKGDGGSIIVWSDVGTDFAGAGSARGGALGGNGGFAEVSSKGLLSLTGKVDLSAAAGTFGTLLLDPYNVRITSGATTGGPFAGGTFTPGATSVINATELMNQLALANVAITTGSGGSDAGNITVAAPLTWTAATELSLNAYYNIAINSPITATNGSLTLAAGNVIRAPAAVQVGTFTLDGGDWIQNAATLGGTLPVFSAADFRLDGGSFMRVAGGNGGAANPYQITDVYGLQGIGSDYVFRSSHIVLANDIDATGTANWNDGAGFVPIAGGDSAFYGTFNGAGHTIDGLTINLPSDSYVGLFGTAYGALISNVGLTNVNITGYDYVGGLVGYNSSEASDPPILHAFTTGTVSGHSQVGGLVGTNDGSYGGAVSIIQSYSSATVNGTGDNVGGLVGSNESVEYGSATIRQSYATGSVTGGTNVGGLVGQQTNDDTGTASITQSYAVGPVTGTSGVGGLVGANNGGTVTSSFWDANTTGQSGSAGGTGLTTVDFQNPAVFVPMATAQGWNFATTWAPPTTFGGGFYPELYTMSPVVRVVTRNRSRLYGGVPGSFAIVNTDGGPGTYVFGPAGEAVDLSNVLTTTATTASSVGSYPVFGQPAPATPGGVTYRTVATLGGAVGAGEVPALAVNPRPLVITADDESKIYGDTFTFGGTEFTAAGLRNGDMVTSATLSSGGAAATAGVAGGPYAIVVSNAAGSAGLATNYAITYAPGAFTVTPRGLTITASDQTKVYGDTFTFAGTEFTAAGLRNGDTVTSATLSSAGGAATATVAGGPYAIAVSNAVGSAGLATNYAITYAPGAFTVTPRGLTITASDQTKVYGDTFAFGGTEFTATGLVTANGDSVSQVTLASAGAAGTARVAGGPYAIGASNAKGAGLANYAITYAPGSFTVTPRGLTITASDQTKVYGNGFVFNAGDFTATGLVTANGDRINRVTLASAGAAATATVAGGPYAINASNARGAGLSNYAITYAPGSFTVTPRGLTITASDQTKVYGDTFAFGGTEFTAAGLRNGDTVTSATLSSAGGAATATVAGGPYAINASDARGTGLSNYTITYAPGSFTVTPRGLTITADDQTKAFGAPFTFDGTEFTTTGLRNGDTVTSATITSAGAARDAGVAASPYAIDIANALGTGLANYNIHYAPGAFTVRGVAPPISMVPTGPNTDPISDPPDIIDVNLPGGGGGGGPIITLPESGSTPPPSTTLGYVEQTSQQLEQQLAACERRQIRDQTRVYIDCVATALDGFGHSLERRVVNLPPALRAVTAIIRTAAAQVRAARTVEQARAAVQTAIVAVRKVIALLKADDPGVARLQRQQGNVIATALQAVDTHLARATGL